MIKRRSFFNALAGLAALVGGCWSRSRREETDEIVIDLRNELRDDTIAPRRCSSEPTLIDPVARVSRRIEREMSAGPGVRFIDPITLTIISSILCGVMRYCADRMAARVHDQVTRKPNGVAAIRLRGKLRTKFSAATRSDGTPLFASDDAVNKYVDAVMTAFVNSKSQEVSDLIADLDVTDSEPNESDAAIAREWSAIGL